MQDKLLFMGCSIGTPDALNYAKSIHVYTIITDNLPPEQQPLKLQADEYWMIDVKDLDALEAKCKESGVTGVFAATSEFCLDMTRLLCKRLALPFYASDEGWASARDKERFRNHCIACGLNVPKQYLPNPDGTFPRDISWPVIVKPVDSCAQIGISICRNQAELEKGYSYACQHSETKRVLIEEYIEGDELAAFYISNEGHPSLLELTDVIHTEINGKSNFIYVGFQSTFSDIYKETMSEKIDSLCQKLDCKNGIYYFQMIRRDGICYFFEMGYRLNSVPTWYVEEALHNINVVKYMVDLALGHEPKPKTCSSSKVGAVYFLWSRPGQIAKIDGVQTIASAGLQISHQNFYEKDIVPKETSMRQIAFSISVVAKTQSELQEKIQFINCHLHVYNADGEDTLYCFAPSDAY